MPRNRYYQGPPSDHFDGLRFFNRDGPTLDKSPGDILRWKLKRGAATWPALVPVTPARPEARVNGLRVTMVGHATLLIQAAGLNLLTDPVWSTRAGPFGLLGPKRVTAPGIAWDDLPPIDAVLLSHCHYDHLDLATLKRLHARDAPLMAMPLGNDTIVRGAIPDAWIAVGDWGERLALGAQATTALTPANHWSARSLGDRRMALWTGHFLETTAGSVWFAGDTGYGDGAVFRAIHLAHGGPDVALIPIGAFAPRWFMAAQHCDPAEAVKIMADVGAKRALGIHWGTFQLTDEARDEPATLLVEAVAAAGLAPDRFVAAEVGRAYSF